MIDLPVRTPEQLPALLQSLRKTAGLTQAETAARLGVTQQTLSALERRADNIGAARLMKLLAVLGVELVLRAPEPQAVQTTSRVRSAQPRRTRTEPDW